MSPNAVLSKSSKSDEAYRQLVHMIDAGQIAIGELLTEARAARLTGLGRGPVRESILRLEAEGLLRRRAAYCGREVVDYLEDLTQEEVLSRYEFREAVESMAARLAAMNMNGWQISELRRRFQRFSCAYHKEDQKAQRKCSVEYYDYLLANCGNSLLMQTWKTHRLTPLAVHDPALATRIEEQQQSVAEKEGGMHWGIAGLGSIVEAIANHDAKLAEKLTHEKIHRVVESIRATLWNEHVSTINLNQ